jgi:hypothetical protein
MSGALAVLAACALLLGGSCVETAECNESVTCPSGEVCYEFECREICSSDDDCDEDESCLACKPPELADATGNCFGADRSACVPD